jgi:predicted transcriptional regulator of viral defense system
MTVVELREKIPNDIFTVLELHACLGAYCNKAAKVSLLLRRGDIVQIRRGLYTFAASLRRGVLASGVLANRIYGPSYVSEDFALSFHGLIPEMPAVVTSIAMGRSRKFINDFGIFSYRYCRSKAYSIGVFAVGDGQNRFLIATPEKAVFDKVFYDKRFDGNDPETYLLEDLRMDPDKLKEFDKQRLVLLAPFMRGRLRKLHQFLEAL